VSLSAQSARQVQSVTNAPTKLPDHRKNTLGESSPTGFEPPSRVAPFYHATPRKPRRFAGKHGLRPLPHSSRNVPKKPATTRKNRDGLGSSVRVFGTSQ
jgi:hypothetical protein